MTRVLIGTPVEVKNRMAACINDWQKHTLGRHYSISFDWGACVTLAAGELLLPLQQQ